MPCKISKIATAIFPLLFSLVLSTHAQDSLPNFSVDVRNGVIVIGWINPYNDIAQLIIQQSKDSISGFKSVVTMPDPAAVTNGFAYKKPNSENYYYRIFYLRSGSRYIFTAPKKPTAEIKLSEVKPQEAKLPEVNPEESKPHEVKTTTKAATRKTESKKSTVKRIDHITPEKNVVPPVKADSISKTIDSTVSATHEITAQTTVQKIEASIKDDIYNPSGFIFTNSEGNLVVALPDVHKKKFSLHVFTKEGMPIFEMKNIKEPLLQIDKSNFYKSGWFKYELFEAGKLREKNRFYIPADIK